MAAAALEDVPAAAASWPLGSRGPSRMENQSYWGRRSKQKVDLICGKTFAMMVLRNYSDTILSSYMFLLF